jgi:dihydrofolate reductase
MLRFKLIVAMCPNGGIGYKGGLPWPHNKADMAHFAKRTTGGGNNAVIMGAKTWDSIPARPLRRRANLILSSQIPIKLIKPITNRPTGLEPCPTCSRI